MLLFLWGSELLIPNPGGLDPQNKKIKKGGQWESAFNGMELQLLNENVDFIQLRPFPTLPCSFSANNQYYLHALGMGGAASLEKFCVAPQAAPESTTNASKTPGSFCHPPQQIRRPDLAVFRKVDPTSGEGSSLNSSLRTRARRLGCFVQQGRLIRLAAAGLERGGKPSRIHELSFLPGASSHLVVGDDQHPFLKTLRLLALRGLRRRTRVAVLSGPPFRLLHGLLRVLLVGRGEIVDGVLDDILRAHRFLQPAGNALQWGQAC